jgi:hypothetical protein
MSAGPANLDQPGPPEPDASRAASVGELAELYLGNLLYALERCAMSLEGAGDSEGAAYYRGLARALAEAHGRSPGR